MAGVCRGVTPTTGHGQFPPTVVTPTAATVFINGMPVVRKGDPIIPHCRIVKPHDCHGGVVVGSSATIFAEGIPVARIADGISCGDALAVCSSDVFCN